MRLKYYLRGLGLGIIVSTIILSISFHYNRTMSDAEIIKRAEELGMVKAYESGVLNEEKGGSGKETEKESDKSGKKAGQDEPDKASADGEDKGAGSSVSGNRAASSVSDNDTGDADLPEEQTVVITIDGGDGSGTVARKLKSAGLIEDAAEYDRYLCRNGYDKRLCTGKHTIPVGADDAEIAKLITSKE